MNFTFKDSNVNPSMEHREVGVANATEGKLLISLSKIEQNSLS